MNEVSGGVVGKKVGTLKNVTQNTVKRFLELLLYLFYREIEVIRQHDLPEDDSGWILAMNHPNGLVDPLLVLCFSPRHISFLAKSTLFPVPIVGQVARAMDCIPVFRRQDNVDSKQNNRTFELCEELLGQGGALAIFPEGTSHSGSQLRPLKSGIARIALNAYKNTDRKIWIIPVGLFYSDKRTFRSSALAVWGRPIEVPRVENKPLPQEVHALTHRVSEELRNLIVQTQTLDVYRRLVWANHIVRYKLARTDESISQHFARLKDLQIGYEKAREKYPDRLAAIEMKIQALEEILHRHGLQVLPEPESFFDRLRLEDWIEFFFLIPVGVLGSILYFIPYHLIGWLAPRIAKGEDDIESSIKILGALWFLPIWIGSLSVLCYYRWGGVVALTAILSLLVFGLEALVWTERLRIFMDKFKIARFIKQAPQEFQTVVTLIDELHLDVQTLRRRILDRREKSTAGP